MPESVLDSLSDNRPIRDIAYEKLKHAIITGAIPAGVRIVETVYAKKLHVSRTPLREAFRKLEIDGLVEYEVRKGVVVRAFTMDDIEEIFSIRNALMMLIIPSVMERMDAEVLEKLRGILDRMDLSQRKADASSLAVQNREFHSTIERVSGKRRILQVIDSQEEYIKRFSAIAIASVVRRSNAHKEHHQMLSLLERGDLEAFSRLTQHHLAESKETCLKAVTDMKFG